MYIHDKKYLVKKAIKSLKQIKFFYKNHERIANPHHIGLYGENICIHAYQVQGGSVSGHVPSWKNFKIKHISHLKILESNFFPEASFHPQNSHYSKIFMQIYNK